VSDLRAVSLDELAENPERLEALDPAVARSLYVRAHTLTGMLLARALAGDPDRANGHADPAQTLTPDEAATVANVPVSWIRSEARAGRLPSTKLGHYVRIRREDLLRFVESRRRPKPKAQGLMP
jgi:excisionase family DNA binding protein